MRRCPEGICAGGEGFGSLPNGQSGARCPSEEALTAAPKRQVCCIIALVLAAGVLIVTPAAADTKSDLDRAKRQLAALQANLDRATAAWQAAESRLAQTRAAVASTRAEIGRLRENIARIRERLRKRAVMAFENGPASTIDLLLSSRTLAEFSDRMEFLGSVAQSDSDLVLEREVSEEQLKRQEERLASLAEERAATAQRLESSKRSIQANTAAMKRKVDELATKLRQEQQLLGALGQSVHMGAPIARCPVAGPNSFVDSFGWPRSGGRTHQGIDLIAAYGTPVVSVQNGTASRTPNSLGGNAVIVHGPGGDWTYYAHLSRYGAVGRVSVGTVIGYVGATGNAGINHLHFEYHPGGGAAVDPYQALRAVC
jgi:murein DD-endopeptidase MepM/ murein hydrolase activator NlpD